MDVGLNFPSDIRYPVFGKMFLADSLPPERTNPTFGSFSIHPEPGPEIRCYWSKRNKRYDSTGLLSDK